MSLFGDRCVRCNNTRSRKAFEGVPTCDDCERKIKMDREDPRSCPGDSTPMVKEVVSNVVIDRCPKCKGVWLDPGELDVMKKAIFQTWSERHFGHPQSAFDEIVEEITP